MDELENCKLSSNITVEPLPSSSLKCSSSKSPNEIPILKSEDSSEIDENISALKFTGLTFYINFISF